MDILIKNNSENFKKIMEKIIDDENTPIILFDLPINGENNFNEDFEKIIGEKKKFSKYFCVINLIVLKIDNYIKSKLNLIKKNFDLIIGFGGTNKLNRFFIEDLKIDFLLNPHNDFFFKRFDFIHHFNSGLNQNLCNVAKKNKTGFLITLNFFYDDKNIFLKSKNIGRINQNIKFFEKYKLDFLSLFLVENLDDYNSQNKIKKILKIFNISTQSQIKFSNILSEKIDEKKIKICDGIILKK